MDHPFPPPPSPPAPKSNKGIWILLGITLLVCVMVFVGIVAAVGYFYAQKRIERRAAFEKLQQTNEQVREDIQKSIQSGDSSNANAAVKRIKDQMGEFATQMTGTDAAVSAAMAKYLGKVETHLKAYSESVAKIQQAKVLAFQVSDRSEIEANRVILREFLARNERLTQMLGQGEIMVRAELDAAGVPASVRDATVSGYMQSQTQLRPLQLQIRKCDRTLGDTALVVYDLLDKSWGKWSRDETGGALRFQDDATLDAFNAGIEKIQAAGAEQAQAQQKLIATSKALSEKPGPVPKPAGPR